MSTLLSLSLHFAFAHFTVDLSSDWHSNRCTTDQFFNCAPVSKLMGSVSHMVFARLGNIGLLLIGIAYNGLLLRATASLPPVHSRCLPVRHEQRYYELFGDA